MKYLIAAMIAGGLSAACTTAGTTTPSLQEDTAVTVPSSTVQEEPAPFDYASVFGADDRPADDYEQYAVRKSQKVLAFTGVSPGMTVVDMEAGGGLYTELFSRVVGTDGSVYMQNPPEFDAFLGDSVSARVDGRLDNVTLVRAAFDDLSAIPDASADLATWLLGPHELWYTPEGAEPGALGNPDTAFSEISRVLKPGGHFIVLDHAAPAGAPATTGGDTHRIDKAIILAMADAAGLTLVDESAIFANAEDDGTVNVFDPSIRRKTDRFLLKFEKN